MAEPAAPAPQTPPAPGAPPAAPAAPAAAPAPAPGAPPAPRAAAPAAPKKPQKGPDVDNIQFDKHPKLLKRLRQEAARQAARLVQEKLGVSLEEAAELVKKAGAAIDGAPGSAPPAPAPAPGSDREKRVLEKRVAKLTARAETQKRKIVATKKRARDEVVELELRMDALRVGITDEQADFALWQYRKAVGAAPDAESIPDPRPFFEGMRKTHPQIFANAAPAPAPVTLRPTSAPPASRAPGQETPTAAPAGAAPPQKDAFQMSDEEFRRHKAGYGLR